MTTNHKTSAHKDFNMAVRRTLARASITVIGSTWLPGPDGSYANGERGYQLCDRSTGVDTGKIRSYSDILVFCDGYTAVEAAIARGGKCGDAVTRGREHAFTLIPAQKAAYMEGVLAAKATYLEYADAE